MKYQDMVDAVEDAKATLERADWIANKTVKMLEGRLQSVSPYFLKRIKRELRDFNITTGLWKNQKS